MWKPFSPPSPWMTTGTGQLVRPPPSQENNTNTNVPTRTAFVLDENQRDIFEQVGRSVQTVFKTPDRTQTGRKADEDDVLAFVHTRDEATVTAPHNSLVTALTAQDVQNIVFDILDNAHRSKACVKRMAKEVINEVEILLSANIAHQPNRRRQPCARVR